MTAEDDDGDGTMEEYPNMFGPSDDENVEEKPVSVFCMIAHLGIVCGLNSVYYIAV